MNTLINNKAIVVTGGPGMGKTSIINHFKLKAYSTVQESGREIIRNQLATGGDKLPWADRSAFAFEMFGQSVKDFLRIYGTSGYTFLDRGLPDAIGYLRLCGLPVSDEMWLAARQYRYFPKVFITPPWSQIYINDNERKQSFEEAIDTYKVMSKLYNELGYEVIELPKISVADRSKYILSVLSI
jgi:predicted ATPase